MTRRIVYTCSWCGDSAHTRRDCEKYKASRVKAHRRCDTCSDLSHRREQPACPECHQPYQPERMPTLEDVAKNPRQSPREVVFGW